MRFPVDVFESMFQQMWILSNDAYVYYECAISIWCMIYQNMPRKHDIMHDISVFGNRKSIKTSMQRQIFFTAFIWILVMKPLKALVWILAEYFTVKTYQQKLYLDKMLFHFLVLCANVHQMQFSFNSEYMYS